MHRGHHQPRAPGQTKREKLRLKDKKCTALEEEEAAGAGTRPERDRLTQGRQGGRAGREGGRAAKPQAKSQEGNEGEEEQLRRKGAAGGAAAEPKPLQNKARVPSRALQLLRALSKHILGPPGTSPAGHSFTGACPSREKGFPSALEGKWSHSLTP